jgi:hypothetical protein
MSVAMSRIVTLEGNNAQIRIDVLIEANEFKKRRLVQSYSVLQIDSKENDKVIRTLVDQILFLKRSEVIVSLEEYQYLVNQLRQLVESKRFLTIKIKELTNEIELINKENYKLIEQRVRESTKILEFPIK